MLTRRSPSLPKGFRLALACLLAFAAAPTRAQESFVTFPLLPVVHASVKVFDRGGRFVGRILPEKRYWVPIDRIPRLLQDAVVAVEDSRFYEHSGIDIRGIARALVKDVVKGRLAEGGSTITQQLIKNKHLSNEKTLGRKIEEGRLAMEYERKYTKKQILEMYFNEIYYGNGAWGIAQAARLYFDKTPEALSDAECALLAGVPKNPGRYNPLGDRAKLAARRDVVVKRMVEVGVLTEAEGQALRARPAAVSPPAQAPYYLARVRQEVVSLYGGPQILEVGGLEVTTGMDLGMQLLAEKAIREGVKRVSPQLQGALLALDPNTGDVLAAVGGVDFKASAYDRAFVAKRQPGSSIKPLIYAAALEKGVTAGSVWNDTPVAYRRGASDAWKPLNYGREQFGDQSLRQALAHSNNVITIKLLESIGVPYFVEFAGKMGLSLRSPGDLSLALGTDEVTLRDLVQAYAPLANGGSRLEARTILRIYDRNRDAWIDSRPPPVPVLSPAAAFVATQMLRDVLVYGTAKGLKKFSQSRPAAGKTGTTDDYRDAWFVGYTPQIVAGVWVGYDTPRPGGKGFTGGAVAAPIWERFMRPALASSPVVDFPKPETVVTATIDPETGYLATPECPKSRDEFYVAGTEPTEYCPKHRQVLVPPPAAPAEGEEPVLPAPDAPPPQ